MKFSLTDLSKEQLDAAVEAIEALDAKPSKKTSKKVSKKKVVEEEEEEEEESEDEPNFDEEEEEEESEDEDEDEDESEEEESEDEDEEEEEEEEEEVKSKKKKVSSKTKTGKTSATQSGKITLETVIKEFQATHKRLAKKLKSEDKAQTKLNALLKANGAKSTRTLDSKKYSTVLKALKAL